MEFFELKIGRKNNKEWRVVLEESENGRTQLLQKLKEDKPFSIDGPIRMKLVNTQLEEERKEKTPLSLDLFFWSDTFENNVQKPKGSYVIISSKLKAILEKGKKPDHQFIPVELEDFNGNKNQFFLFYIFGKRIENIDYAQSEFILKARRTKEILKTLGTGSFQNFNDFNEARSKYLKTERALLEFDKITLTVDYDIIWGLPNVIYINSILKENVEAEHMNGVEITKIDSPQYRLSNESNLIVEKKENQQQPSTINDINIKEDEYIKSLVQYKDLPLESPRRREYDFHYKPFASFLEDHFCSLTGNGKRKWEWWQTYHLSEIFEKQNQAYEEKVNKSHAPFFVDMQAALGFYKAIKNNKKIDEDILQFIAFLCGGVFFDREMKIGFLEKYNLDFNQFLNIQNWDDPGNENSKQWTLTQLAESEEGRNFIRDRFALMPIFNRPIV